MNTHEKKEEPIIDCEKFTGRPILGTCKEVQTNMESSVFSGKLKSPYEPRLLPEEKEETIVKEIELTNSQRDSAIVALSKLITKQQEEINSLKELVRVLE